MESLDFGVSNPFQIQFSLSPVFECALSIAAYTREEIYEKLEQSMDDLHAIRDRISVELQRELALSGKVHTWRSLLFLAHRCTNLLTSPREQHLEIFLDWLVANEANLIELASPFLGDKYSYDLQRALGGEVATQKKLLHIHEDNSVIHANLQYLFSTQPNVFLPHLKALLLGWYEEVFIEISNVMMSLQQDMQHKIQLSHEISAKDLIRIATKGIELQQLQPGIDTLWLIPQAAYRPFTIVNYLPNCLVYYYPISEEFFAGGAVQTQMMQVAALHKALGDVQRLRLLNLLRTTPKSLAQLTEHLNATKSNIHHHLTLLRTAGLVRVESGRYSINEEAILRVGESLRGFLRLPS